MDEFNQPPENRQRDEPVFENEQIKHSRLENPPPKRKRVFWIGLITGVLASLIAWSIWGDEAPDTKTTTCDRYGKHTNGTCIV